MQEGSAESECHHQLDGTCHVELGVPDGCPSLPGTGQYVFSVVSGEEARFAVGCENEEARTAWVSAIDTAIGSLLAEVSPLSPRSRRRRMWDVKVKHNDGTEISFSKYANEVCLLVNVASA